MTDTKWTERAREILQNYKDKFAPLEFNLDAIDESANAITSLCTEAEAEGKNSVVNNAADLVMAGLGVKSPREVELEAEVTRLTHAIGEWKKEEVLWRGMEAEMLKENARLRTALRGILDQHMSCEQVTDEEEREVHRMYHIAKDALNNGGKS